MLVGGGINLQPCALNTIVGSSHQELQHYHIETDQKFECHHKESDGRLHHYHQEKDQEPQHHHDEAHGTSSLLESALFWILL